VSRVRVVHGDHASILHRYGDMAPQMLNARMWKRKKEGRGERKRGKGRGKEEKGKVEREEIGEREEEGKGKRKGKGEKKRKGKEDGKGKGEGKWGRGKRKGKEKGKEKRKGRVVHCDHASILHRYGDMKPQMLDGRTDGRSGDFILYPMQTLSNAVALHWT